MSEETNQKVVGQKVLVTYLWQLTKPPVLQQLESVWLWFWLH